MKIALVLVIVLASSSAFAETCGKQRTAYRAAARDGSNALDAAVDLAAVRESVARVVASARAVNACLQPIPQTRPTMTGYLVNHDVGSIQECEPQLDALVRNGFLDCVASWDAVANDKYRVPLPADDCSAGLGAFVDARDGLRACHAKYRFNDSTRLKIPLAYPVAKTHGKSDKTGAVCFGAQGGRADGNLFAQVDDGARVRFSGAQGVVAFESLALGPHTVRVFSGLRETDSVAFDFKALKTNFVVLAQSADGWSVTAAKSTTCKP